MSNTTNEDEGQVGISDPLIMFPSSKNFQIEDEIDPLNEILHEFDDYVDEEDMNFDSDKTYIRKLPDFKQSGPGEFLDMIEKFNFYLSEIDQYSQE